MNAEVPPLPSELQSLVDAGRGSLLVKGGAGSGKSMVAAAVAGCFPRTVLVSKHLLASRFTLDPSWGPLKDRLVLVDAMTGHGDDEGAGLAQRVADACEGNGGREGRCLLVIDDPWCITGDRQVTGLLHACAGACNGVVVMTTAVVEPTALDAQFDTVVVLRDDPVSDRTFRVLDVHTSRGVRRGVRHQPFTLSGGRATFIQPVGLLDMGDARQWEPRPDPRGCFSSGSATMDELLGGGLPMGSFNVIEMDPVLPEMASYLLMNPILNFLTQGRGVIVSMTAGVNSSLLNKKDFMTFVDPEAINDQFRILDEKTTHVSEARSYVVQLSKRDKEIFRVFPEVYDTLAEKTSYSPVLSVFEFTPVDFWNADIYKEFFSHVKFVKNSNMTEIAIINSGLKEDIKITLAHLANTYCKLHQVNNRLFITGLKPWTAHHAVQLEGPGSPRVAIHEMC